MNIYPGREYIPLYCINDDRSIRSVDTNNFGSGGDLYHPRLYVFTVLKEFPQMVEAGVNHSLGMRFTTRDFTFYISKNGVFIGNIPLIITCLRKTYFDSGLDISDKANWYYILNHNNPLLKYTPKFFKFVGVKKNMIIRKGYSEIVTDFGGYAPQFKDFSKDQKELQLQEWLNSFKEVPQLT